MIFIKTFDKAVELCSNQPYKKLLLVHYKGVILAERPLAALAFYAMLFLHS